MRKIQYIVLHCTATSQETSIESILNYWRNILNWENPGYHYLISSNGIIRQLLNINKIANGVYGYNANSIHISYIGGIDANGKATDNRTPVQIIAQLNLIFELKKRFPNAEILGHRDFPNVNKECPSFNVKEWLAHIEITKRL
jgi:N-acetylmuramoyl-L-alanine amidase